MINKQAAMIEELKQIALDYDIAICFKQKNIFAEVIARNDVRFYINRNKMPNINPCTNLQRSYAADLIVEPAGFGLLQNLDEAPVPLFRVLKCRYVNCPRKEELVTKKWIDDVLDKLSSFDECDWIEVK